jgi:hypothetical protein
MGVQFDCTFDLVAIESVSLQAREIWALQTASSSQDKSVVNLALFDVGRTLSHACPHE